MHTGARGAAPAFLTDSGGAEARASSSWGTRSREPRHSVATPVSPADPSGPQVFVKCHFDYDPASDSLIPCKEAGLRFCAGDLLQIVNQDDPNWWQVRGSGGSRPFSPLPGIPQQLRSTETWGVLGGPCGAGGRWVLGVPWARVPTRAVPRRATWRAAARGWCPASCWRRSAKPLSGGTPR